MWLVRRFVQSNNRVYRDNIGSRWKRIGVIVVSVVGFETIIIGYDRVIKICNITVNWKGFVKAVINFPVIVFSQ